MKTARHFFHQMNLSEQIDFIYEFYQHHPECKSVYTWLDENKYETFENFIDTVFDKDLLLKPTRRKYSFWFDVMLKYNVSKPTNLIEK